MAICFGGSDTSFSLAFIYLNEILTKKNRMISGALLFTGFAAGEVVFGLTMY